MIRVQRVIKRTLQPCKTLLAAPTHNRSISCEEFSVTRAVRNEVALFSLPELGDLEGLRARYRDHVFAPHAHDTFVIAGIVSGAVCLCTEDGATTCAAEHLLTLDPGLVHSARGIDTPEWEYVAIYPTAALVASRLSAMGADPTRLALGEPCVRDRALGATVIAALEVMERSGDAEARIHAFDTIVRELWITRVATPRTVEVRYVPEGVARVREYIEAHPEQTPTVEMLANLAGWSRFHFIRTFTVAVGLTPYAYFLQRRIAYARELLRAGEPLTDVAHRCGFADQSHFIRHFKRVVGVTPGRYATLLRSQRRSSPTNRMMQPSPDVLRLR